MPNTHIVTGLHYGVINANNINGDVLTEIMDSGTDTHYEEGLEEVKADAGREWESMDEEERFEAGDLEDYIEEKVQEFNDSYESNDAPYEFDIDGVKGVFSTYSNTLMIFESPHVVKATLCSPCYPNAGDLDNAGEKAGSTWAGGPVDTYDVPTDWRNTEY